MTGDNIPLISSGVFGYTISKSLQRVELRGRSLRLSGPSIAKYTGVGSSQ